MLRDLSDSSTFSPSIEDIRGDNHVSLKAMQEDPAFIELMNDVLRNELTDADIDAMWVAEQARRDADTIACQHARERHEAETRVSVAGLKFKAEARVAGGRWVKAGTFQDENEAQRAASAKVAELVEVRS